MKAVIYKDTKTVEHQTAAGRSDARIMDRLYPPRLSCHSQLGRLTVWTGAPP